MQRTHRLHLLGLCFCLPLALMVGMAALTRADERAARPQGAGAQSAAFPFPLPSRIGDAAFEKRLEAFLGADLYGGWQHDREFRSTGPYINGKSYGVHLAVRIYYSPEMWAWMQTDRKGEIPDGAMIIKEQYPLPLRQDYYTPSERLQKARQHQWKPEKGWAIMVRDKQGAWDGWYWSSGEGLGAPGKPPEKAPFPYPWAGFGQYCVNCHASADNPLLTYSTTENVDPNGRIMTYLNVTPTMQAKPFPDDDIHERLTQLMLPTRPIDPGTDVKDETLFAQLYPEIHSANVGKPTPLPGETYDHVVQGPQPKGQKLFVTSDQCMGCHDGTKSNDMLPNMIYAYSNANLNINLSPYGEWRASMMGLAGRDPIFYAQLETERTLYPALAHDIDNKCLSCHGVMGQRQFQHDHGTSALFTHEMVAATPEHEAQQAVYGALARDGVSCAVCHHISDKGLGTAETYTGQFFLGEDNALYGPYKDVIDKPMKFAVGLTARQTKENQIHTSKLCGSCHTVETPILSEGDSSAEAFYHPKHKSHEQSTYQEWRNSIYADETAPAPATAKSCQDCHMPDKYQGDPLKFRIANIEDNTFPFTEHRLPDKDITLKIRGEKPGEPYSRHALVGINLFGIKIFEKFAGMLGIRTADPMAVYGNPQPGLLTAQDAMVKLATQETARIEIIRPTGDRKGDPTDIGVRVTNLTGHKFPSGVGFRRAFLELTVQDARGELLWASGRTSDTGVILDGRTDRPLLTEFFAGPPGHQAYQPYHAVITRENQVQIYEELTRNKGKDGTFTTSFLSLSDLVKDTRLMPKGWRKDGPDAEVTKPDGGEERPVGKGYYNGSGSDEVHYRIRLTPAERARAAGGSVRATLYYQSIPPYYLKQRFETAPNGQATRNLWYYASKLDPNRPNTHIEQWKIKIAHAESRLIF